MSSFIRLLGSGFSMPYGHDRDTGRLAPTAFSDRPAITPRTYCLTAIDLPHLRLEFPLVSSFRVREAAELLGVSDDTVRRWADAGRLPTTVSGGRRAIDGAALARFSEELARSDERAELSPVVRESARNRMRGLVTRVVRDTVMAQVEIQAGPFRIVSLMSREAADELGLEPGSLAVAAVKATNVVVEVPGRSDASG
jgi:molybdopterin-binding protein